MSNPYENLFGDQKQQQASNQEESKPAPEEFDASEEQFPIDQKEPLDEILEQIELFQAKAEPFSKLLSEARVIDHKVESTLTRLFFSSEDPHNQKHLHGEKRYHEKLSELFERIIQPMRVLAEIHIAIVRQFNRDIDDHYYSVEKRDVDIQAEKTRAINSINLQRRILSDAATDLDILEDALVANERRIKSYIDAGGSNNISASEVALLNEKRETLTEGRALRFDYTIFKFNTIDKTAISLGVYLSETSTQYLNRLEKAFWAGK